MGFLGGASGKELTCQFKRHMSCGVSSLCGSPLKYSCLKNPRDRGAWWVTKSGTWLSMHAYTATNIVKAAVLSKLFATAWTVSCQAPPSMGFSRQEYWGGLPCPSPGDLPNPGIEPGSQTLQADFLPSEPPGKPKNTAVNSLALLQGIFSTKESNQGLLNCRWILYQLRYQGKWLWT